MTEQCSDLMHNNDKLTFTSENLDIVNEIDCIEEKETHINFQSDHMYACNSENNDLTSNNETGESEVKQLKELLLVHLDLIQRQSEDLLSKDKLIHNLQRENQTLKERINRYEHSDRIHEGNNTLTHSNLSKDAELTEDMTHDTVYSESVYSEEDSKTGIKLFNIHLPNNIIEDQDLKQEVVDNQSIKQERIEDDEEENIEPPENMVTEMHLRTNSTENAHEKTVKCYGNRNIISRTRSPPLNNLTKLREELSKPVDRNRSKSRDRPQVNNENSIEPSSSKKAEKKIRLNKNRNTNRRKRHLSNTSILSDNATGEHKKTKVSTVKRDTVLTTNQLYYTQMWDKSSVFGPSEETLDSLDTGTTTTSLEVPSWRIKIFTSCYSMEGTENLDDDVYNRRHLRLENDERRRKRWDVQRIREQRHIERLKQRQERIGSGSKTDENIESPASLWPTLDDIKYIEVTDQLPVTAFGFPIPQFAPSEFSIPWLNTNSNSTLTSNSIKKSSRKMSSRRRHKR